MSGYRPMGAGNAAAAKRAYAAAANRLKAEWRADYEAECAEDRACGMESPTFEVWLGANRCSQVGLVYRSAREEAEERVMGGMDWATFNHFADLY